MDSKSDILRNRRLRSYTKWKGNADPIKLTDAGFKFTGIRDQTKCLLCGTCLENWRSSDDPFVRHKNSCGSCKFIKIRESSLLNSSTNTNNNSFCLKKPKVLQGRALKKPESSLYSSILEFNDVTLEKFMNSEIAQCAVELGFTLVKVRDLAKKKVREEKEIYGNAESLIHDLQEDEKRYCNNTTKTELFRVVPLDDINVQPNFLEGLQGKNKPEYSSIARSSNSVHPLNTIGSSNGFLSSSANLLQSADIPNISKVANCSTSRSNHDDGKVRKFFNSLRKFFRTKPRQ